MGRARPKGSKDSTKSKELGAAGGIAPGEMERDSIDFGQQHDGEHAQASQRSHHPILRDIRDTENALTCLFEVKRTH